MSRDYDNDEIITRYALSKQVGSIARGAVFQTSYGELRLTAEESEPVAKLIERILKKRLRRKGGRA